MAIFVFCVNLMVAAFMLTTAVEISALLIGSIVWTLDCIEGRKNGI